MKKYALYILFLCTLFMACKGNTRVKKTKTVNSFSLPKVITDTYCKHLFDSLSSIESQELIYHFSEHHLRHPKEFALLNELVNAHQLSSDSLFLEKVFTWRLKQYIPPTDSFKTVILNARQTYKRLKAVIRYVLPSLESVYHEEEVAHYNRLERLFRFYTLVHYRELLFNLTHKSAVVVALKEEYKLSRQLLQCQLQILDSVYQIPKERTEQIRLRFYEKKSNEAIKYYTELYFSFVDHHYTHIPNQYKPIPEKRILEEYQLLKDDIYHRYKGGKEEKKIPYYQSFIEKEKQAWLILMKHRSETFHLLEGNASKVYQKHTYRMQKLQLIQLKNEFRSYIEPSGGYFSILKENSSYEYLLRPERPRDIKAEAEMAY